MISILPGTKINLAGRDAAVHGACGMLCPVPPSLVRCSAPSGRICSGSSAALKGLADILLCRGTGDLTGSAGFALKRLNPPY